MAIVDTKQMLTTDEAAERIGMTPGRLRQILRDLQKKTPHFKMGQEVFDSEGIRVGIRRALRFWELDIKWVDKLKAEREASDGTTRGRPRIGDRDKQQRRRREI